MSPGGILSTHKLATVIVTYCHCCVQKALDEIAMTLPEQSKGKKSNHEGKLRTSRICRQLYTMISKIINLLTPNDPKCRETPKSRKESWLVFADNCLNFQWKPS